MRDGFGSNPHRALAFCLRPIFSEKPLNTFPDHALACPEIGLAPAIATDFNSVAGP
jgi:hypothetical protein